MYQMSYEDVMEDGGVNGREREAILFERCIALLTKVKEKDFEINAAVEAGIFVDKFWFFLVEDLSNPDNLLNNELKAGLFSIGVYMIKEMKRLRSGERIDLDNIIAVLKTIRDGLV